MNTVFDAFSVCFEAMHNSRLNSQERFKNYAYRFRDTDPLDLEAIPYTEWIAILLTITVFKVILALKQTGCSSILNDSLA